MRTARGSACPASFGRTRLGSLAQQAWLHAVGSACPTSLAACSWVRLPYKLGAHGVRVRLPHKLGRTRLGPLALQASAARGRVRLPCKLCGRYAAGSACPASLTSPPPCLPPQANGSNGGNVALPRKGLSHRGAALKGACVWRAPLVSRARMEIKTRNHRPDRARRQRLQGIDCLLSQRAGIYCCLVRR